MAYTVPRVEITQEFLQVPTLVDNPLAAFVFGPNYTPIRYSVTAEKSYAALGAYNASTGLALRSYPWAAAYGGAADTDLSHLTAYLENVFACYYSSTVTAKGSVAGAGETSSAPVAGEENVANAVGTGSANKFYTNKVQASNVFFAASVSDAGVAKARSAAFSQRDVQVGDWVAVSGTSGGTGTITIFTEIVGIETTTDSNHYVNILRTADRLFDVHAGSDNALLDPDATDLTFALYLHKPVIQMPDSFFLSTITSVLVGVKAASDPSAKITEPGLVDSTAVVPGSLGLFKIGLPAGTIISVATAPAYVYADYRVLNTANSTQIRSLNDPGLVEAALGPVTPENPLAQGVYDALLNSSGVPVYYMGVPTDDLAGYNAVLTQAKRSSAVYGLVPLTFDSTVHDAVTAHVIAQSDPTKAKWRKAWLCIKPVDEEILTGYAYAALGGNNWRVTAKGADPETGTANVFLTLASSTGGVNPNLTTGGVRAGDLVRIYSTTGLTGTYNDYVISRVVGSNTLITTTAVSEALPNGMQIIRTLSHIDQIDRLGAATTGDVNNTRRVNAVFPAYCGSGGVTKEGYYLAAALAGLRSSSLPHRPLTNVEVLGFDDLTDSLVTYTSDELDRLASYGYWIVTQDTPGGTAYTRHQLTTAGYTETGDDPKFSEDSVTTNVDSISYSLQRALSPFIGKYNVNPGTISLVQAAILTQLDYRVASTGLSIYGPQLLSYKVQNIGTSAVFRDRIVADISLTVPIALNKVSITLVVP